MYRAEGFSLPSSVLVLPSRMCGASKRNGRGPRASRMPFDYGGIIYIYHSYRYSLYFLFALVLCIAEGSKLQAPTFFFPFSFDNPRKIRRSWDQTRVLGACALRHSRPAHRNVLRGWRLVLMSWTIFRLFQGLVGFGVLMYAVKRRKFAQERLFFLSLEGIQWCGSWPRD